jgi:hypothetical protein
MQMLRMARPRRQKFFPLRRKSVVAGDASLKTAQLIKMLVDSNHGIYREPGPTSSRPANVCYASDRYRNGEPLKPTRRPTADSCTAANSIFIRSR